uniref:Uncharacterized protein n=1 Tax=Anopheles atroparvus TaxID=41427 RepID=A0A182JBC6_ANOAO
MDDAYRANPSSNTLIASDAYCGFLLVLLLKLPLLSNGNTVRAARGSQQPLMPWRSRKLNSCGKQYGGGFIDAAASGSPDASGREARANERTHHFIEPLWEMMPSSTRRFPIEIEERP